VDARHKAGHDEDGERPMTTAATDRVTIVAPGQTYVGKQGITYGAGASAETVGAERVCMNILPMPPGARAKAHYHNGIETIAYMLMGECAVYYGDAPANESGSPCTWIVVHSSGSDQDGIVLLPELDAELAERLAGK
jgi:uncharacterized RmlC-like cupin family protein